MILKGLVSDKVEAVVWKRSTRRKRVNNLGLLRVYYKKLKTKTKVD